MRKFLITIFFLALTTLLRGQILDPVAFTHSLEERDGQLELVLRGRIDKGWHVYSTGLAEGPISASFHVDYSEGMELDGELEADKEGEIEQMDPTFGMVLRFFENQVTFRQKLKKTSDSYRLEGYLEYGACNDRSCLPPTRVDVSLVNHGAAAASSQPAQSLTPGIFPDDVIYEPTSFTDAASGNSGSTSLWYLFLSGFMGGLLALLTPCVWPIIPLTVSFFLKRSDSRGKAISSALLYGASIVVIYMSLGLLVTLAFGASALNALSTNAVFNLLFFAMLVTFGLSFLGAFELTLPASWTSKVDAGVDKTSGVVSIFLMALCLALVSFSCTGPIVGFLLVEISSQNAISGPLLGMLGFSLALALPFTLFALFPQLLKKTPKKLGNLNVIKVVLGFIELAFSLKFLSVADLAYGWHILDREAFLALWISLALLLAAYLIGWIRFPLDGDQSEGKTSVSRFVMALLSLSFAIYLIPGLWGAPLRAVSAFSPPLSTQDFNLYEDEVRSSFTDYQEGMDYAKRVGKPVLVDFTGYGCVNCRKMELSVWTDPEVRELLTNDYVMISLYVDDKTPLSSGPVKVQESGGERTLRTVGDKWSYLQRIKFGANAQPFYILLDNEGKALGDSYGYDEDPEHYVLFLENGLSKYNK